MRLLEPCSRCSGVSQTTLIQYPGHSETAPSGDSGVSIPGKGVSCVQGARIKDERFGNGRSECWKQGLETPGAAGAGAQGRGKS